LKILAATTNPGKIAEMARILEGTGVVVVPPGVSGVSLEVPEDGKTFEENAVKKAVAYMKASGMPSLADDSGLCVEALGGAPGVRSARFAGPEADDRARWEHLLSLMRGVTDRRAAFVCVAALALDEGRVITAAGRCEGLILDAPRGTGGFGYDPVFLEPASGRTFAELKGEAKDAVSHRGRALRELRARLTELGLA
jgi:XTP/dITP diphosphohydrolase